MARRNKEAEALVASYGLVLGRHCRHGRLVLDPSTGAVVTSMAHTPGDVRSLLNMKSVLARYRKERP